MHVLTYDTWNAYCTISNILEMESIMRPEESVLMCFIYCNAWTEYICVLWWLLMGHLSQTLCRSHSNLFREPRYCEYLHCSCQVWQWTCAFYFASLEELVWEIWQHVLSPSFYLQFWVLSRDCCEGTPHVQNEEMSPIHQKQTRPRRQSKGRGQRWGPCITLLLE